MGVKTTCHFINGQLVQGKGETVSVYNKVTGKVLASFASADENQAVSALEAAERAFKTWSGLSLHERELCILNYANVLESHREEIIELLIEETGKTYGVAEYDFDMIPNCLRYFIGEAKSLNGEVIPDYDNCHMNMIIRKPVGVVVGYLAWNYPLLNVGYKLGPVLASGCTCVLKPSTQTPLATMYVASLAKEAGIPDGVVNVIAGTGSGIYTALNSSKIPAMLTLIGSSATGMKIMEESATSIKRYSLELGGNAPVIVMKDADVVAAAQCTADGKIGNAGQVCVAPNRVFVHESIIERFVEEVKLYMDKVTFGSGKDEGEAVLSPLVSESACNHMKHLVEDAVSKGAAVVCGGKRSDRAGYFFEPTVLTGVTKDMNVYKEEIFGPIVPILSFDDNDDVAALANDTIYGLAAYLYTNDLSAALSVAQGIDSGSVCVNEPFYNFNLPHGGCKQSGVGKDCSRYSLEEYCYVQRISIKYA